MTYRIPTHVLLRATTCPDNLNVPDRLDDLNHDWLTSTWARPAVRTAITVASPALAERLQTVLSDGPGAASVRKIAVSVAAYLLRWRGRSTPFGLFAGVAAAEVGPASIRWSENHTVYRRPDAGWLGMVVTDLESNPRLLDWLQVTTVPTVRARGTRVVAPGVPPDSAARGLAPMEVSVRLTHPVMAALEAARAPVTVLDLVAHLAENFPAAPVGSVRSLVVGLIEQGFLVTDLRPSAGNAVPLADVERTLSGMGVLAEQAGSDVISRVGRLRAIRERLAEPMRLGTDGVAPVGSLVDDATADDMRSIRPVSWGPIAYDTVLDCEVTIPESVVREALNAVDLVHRLSPGPWGDAVWRTYVSEFRCRYGDGTVVPVLDVVSDGGLGYPAGYLTSGRDQPVRTVTAHDHRVQALVQRALVEGREEIVLTDDVIQEILAGEPVEELRLPWRTEVSIEIRAASTQALDSGRFTLLVTGMPRPGSSMIGRHLHLLDGPGHEALARTFTHPGVIAAQVTFTPRRRRNENITRAGRIGTHEIPLDRRPHSDDPSGIPIDDVGLTAYDGRLHLVRISTGEELVAYAPHPLEAGTQTPALARFLTEASTAGCASYELFHRPATSHLPYVPRIRYRRALLAPATWRLRRTDLDPGRFGPRALERWRTTWNVPRLVAITTGETRLPVDLDNPVHHEILVTTLASAGEVELRETANPDELGWIGRAHEFVIPLVQDEPQEPVRPAPSMSTERPVPDEDAVRVELTGHPDRFDDVLLDRLPHLLETADSHVQDWWFWRTRTPRRPDDYPRLVLCLTTHSTVAVATLTRTVLAWCHDLNTAGLISTWAMTPHTDHDTALGSGTPSSAGRRVLRADSEAVLAEIATAARDGMPLAALVAASMIDLAAAVCGDLHDGARHLVASLPAQRGPIDRVLRAATTEAVARYLGAADTVTTVAPLLTAWRDRAAEIKAYALARDSTAPLSDTLPALLHGHHVRTLGIDFETERTVQRLARLAALSLAHRARAGAA